MGRREFGTIRRLPSGRWQASYWCDGNRHFAPNTFRTKSGERVTAPSQTLPPGILEAFRSGAKVSIQYLPENPTTIRFADQVYYSDNRLAAFALMLGGMIWFFLVWRARED